MRSGSVRYWVRTCLLCNGNSSTSAFLLQSILEAHRDALDAAADALMAKETLTGDEVLEIMRTHPPRAVQEQAQLEAVRVRA